MWQFQQPEVLKYEPKELLPGDPGEDVTGFVQPQWVVKFQVRRTFRLFGRTLWTGRWRAMQLVVPR